MRLVSQGSCVGSSNPRLGLCIVNFSSSKIKMYRHHEKMTCEIRCYTHIMGILANDSFLFIGHTHNNAKNMGICSNP
jgi:hypothetical protein